jgi:hypothetical protein
MGEERSTAPDPDDAECTFLEAVEDMHAAERSGETAETAIAGDLQFRGDRRLGGEPPPHACAGQAHLVDRPKYAGLDQGSAKAAVSEEANFQKRHRMPARERE